MPVRIRWTRYFEFMAVNARSQYVFVCLVRMNVAGRPLWSCTQGGPRQRGRIAPSRPDRRWHAFGSGSRLAYMHQPRPSYLAHFRGLDLCGDRDQVATGYREVRNR